MDETLGARIFAARRARDMTQEQLAERLSARLATVSGWEPTRRRRGSRVWWEPEKAAPGADYLALLPAALGVDGHWLLTGEGEMFKTEPSEKEAAFDRIVREIEKVPGVFTGHPPTVVIRPASDADAARGLAAGQARRASSRRRKRA